jgi:hypothetical protein
MIPSQNSIMHLLIGKNIARTASVTALDPAAATYAASGEIVVTDVDGTVLDSTTVLTRQQIVIVQSQGAALPSIKSPVIDKAGVKTYNSKLYVAPVLQVDYIGYNAVTGIGDIDVINSNGYEIAIKDINSAAYGSTGIERFGFFVSDSSATKDEILDGLTLSLYQNQARIARPGFIVERVASATSTNNSAATGTVTVVNGSKTATASVSATAELAVGDYIRFGTTVAVTAAIYRVAALSGTTITLDIPYQGVGATFGATATSKLPVATAIAGKLGIRLTAKAESATIPSVPQANEPYSNQFITRVQNAGATPVVNQVAPNPGSGTASVVSSLEQFLIGNEGFIARNNMPYVTPRSNTSSTGTYNFLDLEFVTRKTGQIFDQEAASKQLLIAFDFTPASAPTQVTGAVTSVQTVLNAWLSTFTAATLA